MSSIKSIGHPDKWLTTTRSTKHGDVVEDILIGGKQTKTLSTMNERDHAPEKMIGKLQLTAANTSDAHTRIRAKTAIEHLTLLSQDLTATETQRRRILNCVNAVTPKKKT